MASFGCQWAGVAYQQETVMVAELPVVLDVLAHDCSLENDFFLEEIDDFIFLDILSKR